MVLALHVHGAQDVLVDVDGAWGRVRGPGLGFQGEPRWQISGWPGNCTASPGGLTQRHAQPDRGHATPAPAAPDAHPATRQIQTAHQLNQRTRNKQVIPPRGGVGKGCGLSSVGQAPLALRGDGARVRHGPINLCCAHTFQISGRLPHQLSLSVQRGHALAGAVRTCTTEPTQEAWGRRALQEREEERSAATNMFVTLHGAQGNQLCENCAALRDWAQN